MASLLQLPKRGRPRDGVVHGDFRAWAKLRAGMRRFGIVRTLAGLARLAWARGRQRGWHTVREDRDGLVVGFGAPRQRPSAMLLYGRLTEPEYELVRRLVCAGSLVFDVGGGIGTYALVAARHGATVHVFEPWHENVAAIRRNALANGLGDAIHVHAAAVSDRTGSADLALADSTFATRIAVRFDDPKQGRVPTVVLDDYCRATGIDAVDVLKVDVEGHEYEVLAGARGLLARGAVQVVILELGRAYAACRRLLQEFGYEVMFYLDDTDELLPMSEGDHANAASHRPTGFHCNAVAIAPASVAARPLSERAP